MSTLQTTDLFPVTRGADTYKVTYQDIIDGVQLPAVMEFKGVVNPTAPMPVKPADLKAGMVYAFSPAGAVHASWVGVGAMNAADGQLAVWEGSKWELMGVNASLVVPDSTETVKGIVELATAAETTAGTDNTRAVHPAGLKAALTSATSGFVKTANAPLSVTSSALSLGVGKGLHLDANKLAVEIGDGLEFDGNKIKAHQAKEQVKNFVAQVKSISDAKSQKWSSGGSGDSMSGGSSLSFDIPAEANRLLVIVTGSVVIYPNTSESYPSGFNSNRARGSIRWKANGRNINPLTGGQPGVLVGAVVAQPGGTGSYDWQNVVTFARVDEYQINTGSGNVTFTMEYVDWAHNKVAVDYNKGTRIAVLPFTQ